MPSCDGSNCGACSACGVKTVVQKEYAHLSDKERREYEKRISKLEKELEKQKGINQELIEKILSKFPSQDKADEIEMD